MEVFMAHRKRHKAEKGLSLYERITQKIVDELKEGTVPWVKPWNGNSRGGLPRNYVSNRPYSGINVLLTWLSALEHGFTDTRWLTANQIIELGGSFKGESATRIVFAKTCTRAPGTDDEKDYFVSRLYNVFNAEQVSGVELEPEEPPPPFAARLEHAEAFIAAQGVPITHGGDRAFYLPSKDAINLPFPGSFTKPQDYYAVALHELAHASGHPQRLNRPKGAKGSPEYATEELVAELTATFVCAELGIPAALHHTGYIGTWVELLENDSKAIFNASREASRAAAFLNAQARSVPALAEAA
jgi:antirestriction protein ArdC